MSKKFKAVCWANGYIEGSFDFDTKDDAENFCWGWGEGADCFGGEGQGYVFVKEGAKWLCLDEEELSEFQPERLKEALEYLG